MKLFNAYNRVNLLSTISIFLLSSLAFYFLIHYILVRQVDEDLLIEKNEILTFAREHGKLPESVPVRDQVIEYRPVLQPTEKRRFLTAALYDSLEHERGDFRMLVFGININHQFFQVTVAKALEESDKLGRSIFIITILTILLILLVNFGINRIVVKKLWSPFYATLEKVARFQVSSGKLIEFPRTDIDEFIFMNHSLEVMTAYVREEYKVLREFTENASHEMQTPLSVIRTKLDLLAQDERINEEQSQLLHSAYEAVYKLSRLNQSLLLLARIENNQFEQISSVNLREKLQLKVEEFRELWQAENLSIDVHAVDTSVEMNPMLADTLLNNLLSNATRHNQKGGMIEIKLTGDGLTICNTGSGAPLDKDRLFKRFYKPSPRHDSNGLGLSIIKQICDASNFTISYFKDKDFHCFRINWPRIPA